jgi:hypothetical protein
MESDTDDACALVNDGEGATDEDEPAVATADDKMGESPGNDEGEGATCAR